VGQRLCSLVGSLEAGLDPKGAGEPWRGWELYGEWSAFPCRAVLSKLNQN
jgi:hypothetical protein